MWVRNCLKVLYSLHMGVKMWEFEDDADGNVLNFKGRVS